MKTALFLATVLLGTGTLLGCSSGGSGDPYGATPDFNVVQGRFDHPDGTLNSGNAGSVFGTMGTSSSAGAVNVFGGGSSSSSSSSSSATPGAATTQALHLLTTTSSTPSCPALQQGQKSGSCACPSGGTFQYEIDGDTTASNGNADVTMRVAASACASGNVTIDGTEYANIKSSAGSFAMLVEADLTVTEPGKTVTLNLDESITDGGLALAVKVADGYVVMTATSNGTGGGTFTIRDRQGTWTCTSANGTGGSCTGPGGSVSWS